jgi:cytoskeleton protein RodZ
MNHPIQATAMDDTMGPREIGALMGKLREDFALTQQQVSQQLHIRTRYVAAIEAGTPEVMPGKVYARGYVQTYAEFLGLHVSQVLAQYFIPEAADAPATAALPASRHMPRYAPSSPSRWRGYAILAVVAAGVAFGLGQLPDNSGSGDDAEIASSVAPVPEEMLQYLRTGMMPTAANYDCLMRDRLLGCLSLDAAAHRIIRSRNEGAMQWMEPMDVSALAVPLPVVEPEEVAVVPDAPEAQSTPPARVAPTEKESPPVKAETAKKSADKITPPRADKNEPASLLEEIFSTEDVLTPSGDND